MSGPKTARYVMTEEDKKRMEEQQRRYEEQQRMIRKIKAAQNRRSSLQRKCSEQWTNLLAIIGEYRKLSMESGLGAEELEILESRQREIEKTSVSKENSEDLEFLQEENRNLEALSGKMNELKSRGDESLRKISAEYQKELSEVIVSGFDFSFANLESGTKVRENQFFLRIADALKRIDGMELTPELKEKFQVLRKRADEIKSVDFLENFCSMQIYPFVKECEFYREHADEFEELLSHYAFMASEAGETAGYFAFSADSISGLKEEIARLHQKIMYQKEQEYIGKAVDEAMTEMGYELIGERSVTKKNGKKFRNGLYTLEEGTAVNVTFSDSGQISMELGALDTEDRMPAEAEASELADDMRAFCADYAALEKKLSQKGIITKRISVLPASADYAQIFNTSDYTLKRPVETYQKERKKAVSGKRLYKEK